MERLGQKLWYELLKLRQQKAETESVCCTKWGKTFFLALLYHDFQMPISFDIHLIGLKMGKHIISNFFSKKAHSLDGFSKRKVLPCGSPILFLCNLENSFNRNSLKIHSLNVKKWINQMLSLLKIT